jgi:hypothetical protein
MEDEREWLAELRRRGKAAGRKEIKTGVGFEVVGILAKGKRNRKWNPKSRSKDRPLQGKPEKLVEWGEGVK